MSKSNRAENVKAIKAAHKHIKQAFGEVAFVYDRFKERPGDYQTTLSNTLDIIKAAADIVKDVQTMF